MKSVNLIIADSKHIYHNDYPKVSNDGIKGFLTVDNIDMSFIASWGGGWDHVSVSPLKPNKVPTWNQMCIIKDIFFNDTEAVIQIHPPKDQYVNNRKNCLHLWRANDKDMILPPSFMVGLRKGQTWEELQKEIDEYYEVNGYERS